MAELIKNTTDVLCDIRSIIENGRKMAYAAAGQAAIATYWNVGRRIVEEEQNGRARAEYGKRLIPRLAKELTLEYGTGYGKRNLYEQRIYKTCTFNLQRYSAS